MGLFDFLKKPDINEGVRVFRETKGAVLLDVRTDEEYKTSHIPESVSIPLDRIITAPNVLKDKNAPVFSYCLRGSRSRRAVSALRQMGYTNVINIGGIDAYRGEITRG